MRARYLSIAAVTLILGLLIGLQVRLLEMPQPSVAPSDRVSALSAELSELTKENENLRKEIDDLEEKVRAARQGVEQAEAALRTEIEKHLAFAGLTRLVGPGVEVILENVPGGDYLFLIRDEDLLRVVNELRSAGAEAVAVNDQRLVASSEIRQAGPFINVNLQRVSPPYRIRAIGDPDKLRRELERAGGLADTARYLGMEVTIEVKEELVLPAYQGHSRLEFAKPLKEGV